MVKFARALSQARDPVDLNIAAGEAVPRWERLKTTILTVLVVVCLALLAGYVHVQNELNQLQRSNADLEVKVLGNRDRSFEHQRAERVQWAKVISLLEDQSVGGQRAG